MVAAQQHAFVEEDLLRQAQRCRRRLRSTVECLQLGAWPALATRRRSMLVPMLETLCQCVNDCFAIEDRLGIFSELVPSLSTLRVQAAALHEQRRRLQTNIRSLATSAACDDVIVTLRATDLLVMELQDHQLQVVQLLLNSLQHAARICPSL